MKEKSKNSSLLIYFFGYYLTRAGKSTTFKAALGLITYDAGNITLMGKAPADLTPVEKQKIGVTLAESGFSGYLKVKDIIPVMSAMYPEFDRSRFESLCRKFGNRKRECLDVL